MMTPARATARLQAVADAQEPVMDYRSALWRIFEHQLAAGIDYQTAPMPWAIQLVADLFWVDPKRVRADLVKMGAVS